MNNRYSRHPTASPPRFLFPPAPPAARPAAPAPALAAAPAQAAAAAAPAGEFAALEKLLLTQSFVGGASASRRDLAQAAAAQQAALPAAAYPCIARWLRAVCSLSADEALALAD